MLCFFKLPHSFDVSHCFIIIILDKNGTTSPDAQFSHQRERSLCVSTIHSSLALCCPLCTLKCLLFQSFVYCGSSVLKALPTCLYVGRSRGYSPPQMFLGVVLSLAAIAVSISFYGTWQYLLTGQSLTWHLVNQSPVTDELSFIQEVQSNVYVISKKPIFGFRHLYCWTTWAFSHSGGAFFPAVLHQMPHPGSFTNLIKCKDVGLLNGTPRFFLHGRFCMKKKEACSIHKSDVERKNVHLRN